MTFNYVVHKAWRKKYPEKRRELTKRYYDRFRDRPNRGQPWTDDDDEQVLAHAIPDRELSERIGRGVQAIQLRRSRLKKLMENDDE